MLNFFFLLVLLRSSLSKVCFCLIELWGTPLTVIEYQKQSWVSCMEVILSFYSIWHVTGRYSVSPLVAVGWEGFFGTVSVLLFIPILSIPSISALSSFFDLPRGWNQMINTPNVLYSSAAICLSIALFNFFGLSVTRHVSATARSLTDTCRTLSIWIVSLGLGWEKLLFPISLLQVLGFSVLV